jgi:hypothetical protein
VISTFGAQSNIHVQFGVRICKATEERLEQAQTDGEDFCCKNLNSKSFKSGPFNVSDGVIRLGVKTNNDHT